MNLESTIPTLIGAIFVILALSLILKMLKQPYVLAYILSGVLIGPYFLNLVKDVSQLSALGEIGIIFLMFFVGLEVSLPKLVSNWKIAVVGPIFQIIFGVGVIAVLGSILSWPFERIILLGFIITLSSTAVVIKILEDWKELDTKVGQNVLGILLVQDVAIIPMIIILETLKGEGFQIGQLPLKLAGGAIIVAALFYIMKSSKFKLPLDKSLKKDHELQVFMALLLCFGFAVFTSLFGLSAALGAFFAGIVVSAAKETHWVHDSLHSFRVIFVSLFFIYIGAIIDVPFLIENLGLIMLIVFLVFLINTLTNTIILRMLGDCMKESIYAASLLAQIGEFSFLLGAVGMSSGIITEYSYQIIISVISLSLLLSPLWIMIIKKFMHITRDYIFEKNC